MNDVFAKWLECSAFRMELTDQPIVFNLKANKHERIGERYVLAQHQSFLIQSIEIKGIKRKDTLFNSKDCKLNIHIASKTYGSYTLQLFHWNKRKESYIYELSIPYVILPLQQYGIDIEGVDGKLIIILHGKNARPIQ